MKFVGDAVLAAFDSAEAGLTAAIGLQSAFADGGLEPKGLRIGMHLGEISEGEDKDVLGHAVNVASRVQSEAEVGMVAITGDVRSALRPSSAFAFRPLGPTKLKGLEDPVELYEARMSSDSGDSTWNSGGPVWRTKLHHLYYINVPRISLLASRAGLSIDLSDFGEIRALHELGWDLNRLMNGFEKLLTRVELTAIDLAEALSMNQGARGVLVSFERTFRTRNVRMPQSLAGYDRAVTGNLETDPHLYAKVRTRTVYLRIDPRWITTTTAFAELSPSGGQGKFAGLGVVNSVDEQAQTANVTPYLVGLPSNPFMEAFWETS